MSKGINKVTLLGYIGNNPEIKILNNNSQVVNIDIATGEKWKDNQGVVQESTEWHKVKFFNKLADVAGKYLNKGSRVHIEGRLKTREWQDKHQSVHRTTEIIAQSLLLLSYPDNQSQPSPQQSPPPVPTSQVFPPPLPSSPPASQTNSQTVDDDMPF